MGTTIAEVDAPTPRTNPARSRVSTSATVAANGRMGGTC